jgi:uncharacterized protein involved in cysteine biosynthesis
MLRDLTRAFGQLDDPAVRRCLWQSVLAALATFVLLVIAVEITADLAGETGHAWLDWLIRLLAVGGAFITAWMLFPAVVSIVLGFLLDRVVDAVERRWYPWLGPPAAGSLLQATGASLRLVGLAVLLNILVLPLYFVPGVNVVLFLGLNGYLLGREYYELVAQRRMPPAEAAAERRRHGAEVWLAGAAVAFLLTVPFINLVAPLVGIALMTHRFHRLRERDYSPSS